MLCPTRGVEGAGPFSAVAPLDEAQVGRGKTVTSVLNVLKLRYL